MAIFVPVQRQGELRFALGAVLTPDRWLLWLGVLFVLSVYHFPTGVVGRLRALALREGPRP